MYDSNLLVPRKIHCFKVSFDRKLREFFPKNIIFTKMAYMALALQTKFGSIFNLNML